MLAQALLYLLTLVGVAAIGLMVISRNHRPVFVYFGVFSFLLVAFLACQYFVSQGSGESKLWIQLSLIISELLIPFFLGFISSYPARTSPVPRQLLIMCTPLIILGPLSFSPLLIRKATVVEGNLQFTPGILYGFQSFVIITAFAIGIVWLLRRLVVVGAQERKQVRSLLLAFTIPLIVVALTGTIFSHDDAIQVLRPLSVLIMVLIIAYTMIYHGLFDIHKVVARVLGYGLSLVVLASLYGFVVFGVAVYVFHLHIPLSAQIALSAATGASGLIFPILRTQFDKLTNKVFYRDAYDAEALFDQLNKALVSSIDVDYLMSQSVTILRSALRPEYILIGLRDDGKGERLFGDEKSFATDDIQRVRRLTPRLHQKVILTDYLDDEREHALKKLLRANDVAALVRLTQDISKGAEGLGYIVLGPRRSGHSYSGQDVRTLESAANALVVAIQNALHYEEVQHFNQTLRERVEKATRELRRTNEKLQKLDETKDDFISMASHQLRTPLTSIKGYLSMVLEGDAGKLTAQQEKMLNQSFASSQRMVYLISDLLNLSRLNTGKFVIEQAPVNLADAVQTEVDQLTETAEARGITLTYRRPPSFPTLLLDETKTHQVIMNFMDNAVYYTPPGGHIEVSVVETPTAVEYLVKDDGIGVPKHERPHLFTKFYRAGNARKARPDGTGLGLFMAKKVILAQGGSIIFESEEGRGSTFGFRFTKADHIAPAEAAEHGVRP